MADHFAIEGLAAASRLLKEFPEQLQANVLVGAMKAAADSMVAPLQAAAPVRTGHLEESITSRRESVGKSARRFGGNGILEVAAVVAIDRPGRRYWHLSEYGTVNMPARPWARPTFAAQQSDLIGVVKTYVSRRAIREAKKLGQGGVGG